MIRRFAILAVALLMLSVDSLLADIVSGSVSCSVPTETIAAPSPGSCAVGQGDPFSATTLSASASTTAGIGYVQATVEIVAFLLAPSGASASADVTETFMVGTAGPLRPGYFDVAVITPYGGTTEGVEFLGYNFIGDNGGSDMRMGYYPVTLGTTFQIELFAVASLNTYDTPVNDISQASASIYFSFYEQDQTTSVPDFIAADAPEPNSGVLGGLGLLLLAITNYKRLIRLAT